MASQPTEIVLAERPTGEPTSSTFRIQPQTNPPTTAPPGGVLLHLVALSVDPYLRGLIRRAPLDAPLTNFSVARVAASDHHTLKQGDHVITLNGFELTWQTAQQHSGADLYAIPATPHLPLTAYLGVLGLPGRSAYFGLLDADVGRMHPGKTVLVSGAAGAVGSLAGQLARIKGAKRVVGTAGGAEKCRRVVERYGFDECIDYKAHDTVESMVAALKQAAPDGIDIFFDNTGGHVLTAAFQVFNKFGRMVLCGNISSYNKAPADNVIPNIFGLDTVFGSINIRAFVQGDFHDRFQEFYNEVPQLIASGQIAYDETVYRGIDKVPEAFAGLFKGHNVGKAVVLLEGDGSGGE